MQLIRHPDAAAFLGEAQADLEEREAEHNLMLGVALTLQSRAAPPQPPPFFATVHDSRGLAVAALRTPPMPLVLSSFRDEAAVALGQLAEELYAADRQISGVVAPNPVAEQFAGLWSQLTGQAATVGMRQRLYSLCQLQPVRFPHGTLRRAAEADAPLVGRWMAAFSAEAEGIDDPAAAQRMAEQRIAHGEIYLWEDSEPRSMAARARATRHGIAVNSVYTPPEWRRRGLATAAAAQLTSQLLAEGYSFCVLFTDLDNPTSNTIYMRIGYEPICDFVRFRFSVGAV